MLVRSEPAVNALLNGHADLACPVYSRRGATLFRKVPPANRLLEGDAEEGRDMKKRAWWDLVLWVPTLFLVWVFVRQGISKFSDDSGWARAFAAWHYPVWFRILIGTCETAAAILLLTRRTAPLGAALIAVVM